MVKKRKKRVESLRYLFDYKIGVVIKLVLAMSSTHCVLLDHVKLPLSWSSSYSSIADWEVIVHISRRWASESNKSLHDLLLRTNQRPSSLLHSVAKKNSPLSAVQLLCTIAFSSLVATL